MEGDPSEALRPPLAPTLLLPAHLTVLSPPSATEAIEPLSGFYSKERFF